MKKIFPQLLKGKQKWILIPLLVIFLSGSVTVFARYRTELSEQSDQARVAKYCVTVTNLVEGTDPPKSLAADKLEKVNFYDIKGSYTVLYTIENKSEVPLSCHISINKSANMTMSFSIDGIGQNLQDQTVRLGQGGSLKVTLTIQPSPSSGYIVLDDNIKGYQEVTSKGSLDLDITQID